jgi:hypothetical protein
MPRNTNGVVSGSLDTIQENLALLGAFIALFGLAGVVQFLSPVTILGMADAGTGLFSTGGQFYSFTHNTITYIVTWAMALSGAGIVLAYVADPVTGQMAAGKLTPSEIRERAGDATAEILAGTYFLGLPLIKLFDFAGIWTNYAGTTEFAVLTFGVGVVCAFVVVYLE